MGKLLVLPFLLPGIVWIAIAVILAILFLVWLASTIAMKCAEELRRREEERERQIHERAVAVKRQQQEAANRRKQRAADLAAARRKLEERARLEDKRRVDALGKKGAALLKQANAGVQSILSPAFVEAMQTTTKTVEAVHARLSLWGYALREVTELDFPVPEINQNRIIDPR